MLQPKKTKFRRCQKGRIKGFAHRGQELAFGSFGIKSMGTVWLTGRQIEAARIAVTRYMQRPSLDPRIPGQTDYQEAIGCTYG